MTFGHANLGTTFKLTPPAPPEPPREPRRAEPARSDEADRAERAERDFERALKQELERKQAAVLPLPLPMLAQQAKHPPAEEEPPIDAASAVTGELSRSAAAWMRAASVSPTLVTTPVQPEAVAGELEVAPVHEAHEQAGEVQVLVESHLPPIQPQQAIAGEPSKVHLVEFPQVVTGTVKQMVKDNQPVTQLDFEIAPPHVGPVNLQVQLQNGAVNVQLVALTMQAKQALESQVNNITSILQAHNFAPGQIKVVTAAGGKAGAGSAGQKGDQIGFNFFNGGRRRSASEQESISVTG